MLYFDKCTTNSLEHVHRVCNAKLVLRNTVSIISFWNIIFWVNFVYFHKCNSLKHCHRVCNAKLVLRNTVSIMSFWNIIFWVNLVKCNSHVLVSRGWCLYSNLCRKLTIHILSGSRPHDKKQVTLILMYIAHNELISKYRYIKPRLIFLLIKNKSYRCIQDRNY